ncbi:MAG: glycosyltransferase family 4 protein [Acholeplasmataceae bacterium]|nr:glycosyltransferase family 4 protein [Acholeplasmataceae bacterium]
MNLKIICIHNYYKQPGGEDIVFQAEVELLKKFGHTVVEYIEDNKQLDEFHYLKNAVNAVWSRRTQEQLRLLLRSTKPDLVHFHNTFMRISPAAYFVCKEIGIPVVQTLHNYRLLCPKATLMRDGNICEKCIGKAMPWPSLKYGCYRNSKSATAVVTGMLSLHRWLKTWQEKITIYIALSEFSRQKYIVGGLPGDKIMVKPNFIYPDLGAGEHKCDKALFVGRISAEKGVSTLLEAWQQLKEIPLSIIGNGPLDAMLRQKAFINQLSDIELLGWKPRNQVLQAMQEMRLLIFPSESYEAFSMIIVEAFGCGLPVIASRLGTMAEIIQDGHTGLLFTPGDPNDLAAKVKWAWANPTRMTEMGKAARKEFEKKYTADKNYSILMEIYQKAIEINKFKK